MDINEVTLDDLYARLGSELDIDGFGGDDIRLLKARAMTWMSANRDEIKRRVCPMHEQFSEATVDAAAIADGLSALVGRPACLTVAAIVLKIGLARYCQPT
ncbi:MAG TPA: hypothetical protein VFC00_40570 [Micromonosporaceae bacterium]|nr:hypothetical protein [Micromonosporaceae bacterium]